MREKAMRLKKHVRAAFTLVELLVVMAIIAILVGLTTAGVFSYFRKIPDIRARNDIINLQNALTSFRNMYGAYPPSTILLSKNPADYASDPKSMQYLQAMFGSRLDVTQCDWAGGQAVTYPVRLEGDQCLVFFLAGINGTGFSTNKSNPTLLGGQRKGPFIDNLDQGRLVLLHGNPFPSYLDAYYNVQAPPGVSLKPYLYFSSGLRTNGYNGTQPGDCPSFAIPPGPAPMPFINPANGRFYNADSYQIISAGRDHLFGPGGLWSVANADAYATTPGGDDLTNIHGNQMGAGD
jgi:prepilin-type N-terminal cleavage/methylation domain-containing protein